MLLDVPDKCGGAEASDGVFLLLVIKSSPGNYENREVLRKTWAKERLHNGALIRRLFITGTEQTGFEKARQNQLLQLEQSEYGDILQWDFTDSFYNLTLKQVLFLQWIDRNCPHVRFLLNGDDDVFANTGKMVEYLQGLDGNDGDKHLFSGNVIYNSSPIRSPSKCESRIAGDYDKNPINNILNKIVDELRIRFERKSRSRLLEQQLLH
ncbi:hypothetical protein F2P81_008669 [Scophthalmus maximus]|uniref:Hexosyltransferase n=1 Tax=Scophthalmus maximus TaxID=52904 RepID=A0A6A4SZI6_SCOMX|nr:hypothetical protein F2P81_008669 [Scophthalmus maximus]